jgi:hypothetical protein
MIAAIGICWGGTDPPAATASARHEHPRSRGQECCGDADGGNGEQYEKQYLQLLHDLALHRQSTK